MIPAFSYGPNNEKNLLCRKYPIYGGKKKKTDLYFAQKEKRRLEDEIREQESELNRDLKMGSEDYNTRLMLDSMYQVESEINATNIVKTERWGGTSLKLPDDPMFSLLDVYVKIVKKKDAFERYDVLHGLQNISFVLKNFKDDGWLFARHFISALGFELINKQDVLLEENVLYMKVFTFEKMRYGLPNYLYKGNPLVFDIWNGGLIDKMPYDIEVIFSGKNIHLNESVKSSMISWHFVTNNFITGSVNHLLYRRSKIHIPFDATEMIWFIMTKEGKDYEQLEETGIQSVDFFVKDVDDGYVRFEKDEFIHVQIFGIDLYLLIFDEELRDIRKFQKYINNDFDFYQSPYQMIDYRHLEPCDRYMYINHNTEHSLLYMVGLHIELTFLGDEKYTILREK